MLLFTAIWCEPCKELKRWMVSKGIEVETVDLDDNFDVCQKHGVRTVPQLIVDGERYVGREQIKPYLESIYE